MKDKPILFTPGNIRKIRNNEKTQTRRVVKPTQSTPKIAPLRMEPWIIDGDWQVDDDGLPCWAGFHPEYPGEAKWFSCPYGHIGDRLWVKESLKEVDGVWRYAIDSDVVSCAQADETAMITWAHHKETSSHSALFMPKWAARTWLEITAVRVEQLQEITEEDSKAEGCIVPEGYLWRPLGSKEPAQQITSRQAYEGLWDSINGKEYPWSSNPWVWVIDFSLA